MVQNRLPEGVLMRGPEGDSAPRSSQEAPRAQNLVFYEEKTPSKIECCKFAGSPKSSEPRVLQGKMRVLTRPKEIPRRPQEPETSYFTKETVPNWAQVGPDLACYMPPPAKPRGFPPPPPPREASPQINFIRVRRSFRHLSWAPPPQDPRGGGKNPRFTPLAATTAFLCF